MWRVFFSGLSSFQVRCWGRARFLFAQRHIQVIFCFFSGFKSGASHLRPLTWEPGESASSCLGFVNWSSDARLPDPMVLRPNVHPVKTCGRRLNLHTNWPPISLQMESSSICPLHYYYLHLCSGQSAYWQLDFFRTVGWLLLLCTLKANSNVTVGCSCQRARWCAYDCLTRRLWLYCASQLHISC